MSSSLIKSVTNVLSEDLCFLKCMYILAVMCGLYLVCAVPTYASAVGISDRTLNMTLSDDGVRKRDVVGETTTPDGEGIEKHGEEPKNLKYLLLNELSTTGNKPVINKEVIFLSGQCLPDIRLLLLLFVEGDVLCQSLGQHGVQALCLLPLLVNHHVDHVLQTLTLQLLAQAVHSAQKGEIRVEQCCLESFPG